MKVVVLLSGGMDSATLLAHALHQKRAAEALWIDYGQPAGRHEGDAVRNICAVLGVSYGVARIEGLSLATMADRARVAGPRVVPNRNACLLSLAANYAAARGVEQVWFGATHDDHDAYEDCRPLFIETLAAAIMCAVNVRIGAPFLHRTKAEIAQLARDYRLDPSLTWSCYAPDGDEPCGGCNACVARRAALA